MSLEKRKPFQIKYKNHEEKFERFNNSWAELNGK